MAKNFPSLNSHAPCPPTCIVQPRMHKNKTSSDMMLPAWHGCLCVAGLLIKAAKWLAISSTFVSQPVSSPSSRLRMSVLCHYRRLNCHGDRINSHLTTFPRHFALKPSPSFSRRAAFWHHSRLVCQPASAYRWNDYR